MSVMRFLPASLLAGAGVVKFLPTATRNGCTSSAVSPCSCSAGGAGKIGC